MKILWLGYENKLGIEDKHEVLIRNRDNFSIEEAIVFNPNLVIEREFNDGKSVFDRDIKGLKLVNPKLKTAVWLIDTHVGYDRHKKYMVNFDYVFIAISKYADEFKKFWLPLCYPKDEIDEFEVERSRKIGFVGRWGKYFEERNKMLALMSYFYGDMFLKITNYDRVYQIMSKIDIMVNRSIGIDMNYRVFEALGCGNRLLTNDVADLYKIKDLAKYINIYKNYTDMIIQADIMIKKENNNRSEAIKYIKQYHMLQNRINSMLKMIATGRQEQF